MAQEIAHPKAEVLGRTVTLNLWGKADLLLSLLYKEGLLPDCHIYTEEGSNVYLINGHPVGTTEEEVTTNIWLMVERWSKFGYLFE